jgi:hypothetical protein
MAPPCASRDEPIADTSCDMRSLVSQARAGAALDIVMHLGGDDDPVLDLRYPGGRPGDTLGFLPLRP